MEEVGKRTDKWSEDRVRAVHLEGAILHALFFFFKQSAGIISVESWLSISLFLYHLSSGVTC